MGLDFVVCATGGRDFVVGTTVGRDFVVCATVGRDYVVLQVWGVALRVFPWLLRPILSTQFLTEVLFLSNVDLNKLCL